MKEPTEGWRASRRAKKRSVQRAGIRMKPQKNGASGAPGETRTPDPLLRRQTLYPAELRARRVLLPILEQFWRQGLSYCSLGLEISNSQIQRELDRPMVFG